jgi:hypothetical protein
MSRGGAPFTPDLASTLATFLDARQHTAATLAIRSALALQLPFQLAPTPAASAQTLAWHTSCISAPGLVRTSLSGRVAAVASEF